MDPETRGGVSRKIPSTSTPWNNELSSTTEQQQKKKSKFVGSTTPSQQPSDETSPVVSISDLLSQLATSYFKHHLQHSDNNNKEVRGSTLKLIHKTLLEWQHRQPLDGRDTSDDRLPLDEVQRRITESLLANDSEESEGSALKFQKVINRLKKIKAQPGKSQLPIETLVTLLFLLKDRSPDVHTDNQKRWKTPAQYNEELNGQIVEGIDDRRQSSHDLSEGRKDTPVFDRFPRRGSLDSHQELPDLQSSSFRLQLLSHPLDDRSSGGDRQKRLPSLPSRLATTKTGTDPARGQSGSGSPSGLLNSYKKDQKNRFILVKSREAGERVGNDTPYPYQVARDQYNDEEVLIRSAASTQQSVSSPDGEGRHYSRNYNKHNQQQHPTIPEEDHRNHVADPLRLVEQPVMALSQNNERVTSSDKRFEDEEGSIERVPGDYRHPEKRPAMKMSPAEISECLYYKGLPQTVLLRDLLYPLQGIDGMYIKYHDETNSFLVRRDINVSESVRVLVSRLCVLGANYRRIRQHLDSHLLPTASSKRVPKQQVNEWWDEGVSVTVMPSSAPFEQSSHPPVPTIQSPASTCPNSPRDTESPSRVCVLNPNALHRQIPQKPKVPVRSLIYDAFGQFLRDQLTEYYKLLAVIETELPEYADQNNRGDDSDGAAAFSTGSTLRRMAVWLQDPSQRLATLAAVADAVIGLKAGPLLSTVFDLSRRGDTDARVLLGNMLNAISSLWYDMVSNWIRNGHLNDPFDEFCILQNPRCWKSKTAQIGMNRSRMEGDPSTLSSLGHARGSRGDNSVPYHVDIDNGCLNGTLPEFLWNFGFAIDDSRVPVFISSTIAQKILTSGKAIAAIKLFQFLEQSCLHPSAVYMRSSSMREQNSATAPLECHRNPPGHHNRSAVVKSSSSLGERVLHSRHRGSAVMDDALSDYGMKSDISVINGGSPICTYGSLGLRRDSAISMAGISPLRLDGNLGQQRRFQPKYVRLLECMSSGIGISQNLLLGIFDPTCDFDSETHHEPDRHNEHNKSYERAGDSLTQRKSFGTGFADNRSYGSEIYKQDGFKFIRNLCGGTGLFEFPAKAGSGFAAKRSDKEEGAKSRVRNDRLTIHDMQDLETHVNLMEMQHCNKIVDLLLFRYHLLCHCEGIRRLLLLGQGDFVESLLAQFTPTTPPSQTGQLQVAFDFVGCDLNQPASNVLFHHLKGCLQGAISASNAHLFPDEILRRVDIYKLKSDGHSSESKDLIGWDVVTLTYVTRGSPVSLILNEASIKGYRKLHSLLWRMQRLSSSMNRVWCDHIRTARRRLLPIHERTSVSGNVIVLQALDLRSQQAIQRCESVHTEMTHFLRNIYSYLSIEVIETCWIEFLQRVASLCGVTDGSSQPRRHSTDDGVSKSRRHDLSLVDRLIQAHEDYVESMLHGAFLDSVKADGSMATALDILSDRVSPLQQQINQYGESSIGTSQSSSPPVLETLLTLIRTTTDFVELAELIYASIYAKHDQGSTVGTVPLSLVTRLEELSVFYRNVMISFLKQLNTIAKSVHSTSLNHHSSQSQLPAAVSHYSSSCRSDAIRALLSRLDFNGYFGSDWELYRAATLMASTPMSCTTDESSVFHHPTMFSTRMNAMPMGYRSTDGNNLMNNDLTSASCDGDPRLYNKKDDDQDHDIDNDGSYYESDSSHEDGDGSDSDNGSDSNDDGSDNGSEDGGSSYSSHSYDEDEEKLPLHERA